MMNKHLLKERFYIDIPLLIGLLLLMSYGLLVLYSASGENWHVIERQLLRIGLGLFVMFILAQIDMLYYQRWAVIIFVVGIFFLLLVHFFGTVNKGAQRWINLIFIEFQPSELMRLSFPLMMSWYVSQFVLPLKLRHFLGGIALMMLPVLLIASQPDLGTSILVMSSGIFALFFSGISWFVIGGCLVLIILLLPVLWFFLMKEYQKERVLTLFSPESDPLGSGYHIIQSKISIGSGGFWGKGWLLGTQSQLDFLPERNTDFIFAVLAEEFGFIGIVLLLLLYLFIIFRVMHIAMSASTVFGRVLSCAIIMTFFVYIFVNIGMVSGLLPVVGVPLPLVSYGGTSMLTILSGFGLIMSIDKDKRLVC